jgi:uncharacterized protein YjdB
MSLTFRRTNHLLALTAALGLAACGGTDVTSTPTLASIAVTPATATVAVGHTVTLNVAGTKTDGTAQAITDAVWTSSQAGIAAVNATGTVTGIAAGSATITATSSSFTATAVITVTAATLPTVTSIAVSPATVTIAPGATQALTVTATLSDTTTPTVTATATYASSAAAVATVSAAGVITGVAAGSATITVTYQGKTATVAVTVSANAPTLTTISVTPANVSLAIGATQQLVVTGTFSSGPTQNVTTTSTYATSAAAVATVSAIGVVTAVAAGNATITVTDSAKSTTVAVTVLPATATLTSIAVTPASPINLKVAATQQLTVTGTFSDASQANETSHSTFLSGTTSVAAVTTGGLVTAAGPGTSVITVTDGTKTTTVTVNVATPVLQSIASVPTTVSLPAGGTQQLQINGTFDAGGPKDLTSSASFSSNDSTVATVSAGGLVTAVANGNTSIAVSVTPAGGSAVTTSVPVTVAAVVADNSVVFVNGYGAGVNFEPFGGSGNDVTIDTTTTLDLNGHSSLKIVYPASGFTGGAFPDHGGPRDLSGFDSITFWAKASVTGSIEKVGFGNNAGISGIGGFDAETVPVPVTTSWAKFTLPLPDPSRLTAQDGLFHFADGTTHAPFTVWLADIQYVHQGNVAPTTVWANTAVTISLGSTYQIAPSDLTVTSALPGSIVDLRPNLNYFTFSSDSAVATVSGSVVANANGGSSSATANITALIGATASTNHLVVTAAGPAPGPTTLPPVPTQAPGPNVISLYSSVTGGFNGTVSDKSVSNVETFLACFSGGTGGDPFPITVGAATAGPRKYVFGKGAASFIGIEFIGKTGQTQPGNCDVVGGNTVKVGDKEIDVSGMDHFHIDIWTPDIADNFQVRLVDAGNDKQVAAQATLGIATITAGSTPALATGRWLSYDLALANGFPDGSWVSPPTGLKQMAQLILQAVNGGTVYADNMYFYKTVASGGGGTNPTTLAPAPTADPGTVLSLFSSTYSGTAGDKSSHVESYGASCFGPPGNIVADFTIPGTSHVVKKYTIVDSFGIMELIGSTGANSTPPGTDSPICTSGATQTGANELDATAMTVVHVDVWSTVASQNVNVHLVSADSTLTIAGPGAAQGAGGGSDFASGASPLAAGSWTSFDIPLGQFGPPGAPAGLTRLALLKFFTASPGIYYLDNVYLHQ